MGKTNQAKFSNLNDSFQLSLNIFCEDNLLAFIFFTKCLEMKHFDLLQAQHQ